MKKLEPLFAGRVGPAFRRLLVQVLFSGNTAGADLGQVLWRLGAAASEQLIDEGGHLADLGIAEMAREKRGEVVDHAPLLHFADRLGRRADEHPAVLVLAVLLVIAHLDRALLLGVGRQRFECPLEGMLEIAPDVSGPADVERAATPVEYDAGLVRCAQRPSGGHPRRRNRTSACASSVSA